MVNGGGGPTSPRRRRSPASLQWRAMTHNRPPVRVLSQVVRAQDADGPAPISAQLEEIFRVRARPIDWLEWLPLQPASSMICLAIWPCRWMPIMGFTRCARSKTYDRRCIFAFFALRMTIGPKIPVAVIPRGVFTQPLLFAVNRKWGIA